MGTPMNPPLKPSKFPQQVARKSAKDYSGEPKTPKPPSFLSRMLKPLAEKTKVPVIAWEVLVVLMVLGVAAAIGMKLRTPSYQLVDSLTPIHPIRMEVGEVPELDITAYLDIENKLKSMGFAQLTKVQIPEIPTSNLFSVYLNPSDKAYGIILKVPGSNAPRLSFVNVLSNGVWMSTNAWSAKDQELEKLSSESAPKEDPSVLWAHHRKRLEQSKQAGLGVPNANEWRFLSSLSDHLRWYLALKGIPAYKAAFEDWF
jgi:hypothetical protein